MRNHLRISLVFALALLGDAASVYAQGSGSFNRVTTAGDRRSPASSLSRPATVVRPDGTRRLAATTLGDDSLRPYSSQASVRSQGSTPGVPRYSTRQEQPVATREVQVAPPARSYFPGMRSARAVQQPVLLTVRTTGARHICTPSWSEMMGGGGHRR